MKRVMLGWSSGKDSAWTLHALRDDPDVEIVGLLTTLNGAVDRVAMHGVRRDLLVRQARAAGVRLDTVALPDPCTNEDYERLMSGTIARAREAGVTHFAFGDLFLEDVRAYRERQLRDSGVTPLFPLWGTAADTPVLARRMIASGLRAVITCVDTEQLSPRFLGRDYDAQLLAELPPTVDPCGERGEFHTLCYAGPMYERPIGIVRGEVVDRGRFRFIDVMAASHPAGMPA